MPEYLLMVLEDETEHAAHSPAVMAELIEQRAQYIGDLRAAGHLRDHGRFRPSKEGTRMRRPGDRVDLERGPFTEEGRAFGAYVWIEAANTEEATRLASAFPLLAADQIDVRPLMKGRVQPDKEALPGKIFGCIVLGNAAGEDAWTEVMDRIDAETSGNLLDAFLGGLRLEPPTSGQRVAMGGERHAMRDGPFLESKEVIGGVCFVRVLNLDEAVQWATSSRHGVHGALEIRELWRS